MSGGNPFGKDVNKYGSDDWHARKVYDEWKAERHPAPKPSNAPIIPSPMFPNISSGAQRSSSVSAGGSTTGGFTKFLAFVIVVVGFIAYFGSKSDSSRGSVPESNHEYAPNVDQPQRVASDLPTTSTPSASTTGASTTSSGASDTSGVSWAARLSGSDERVASAINDLKAVSGQQFFVSESGTEVVLEGQVDSQGQLSQTSFNIANLDLEARSYSDEEHRLTVPCKSEKCIVYSLFDTTADANNPPLKQRGLYGSMGIYAGSRDDMFRIMDDLQALQSAAH